jgi:hypothetical protein
MRNLFNGRGHVVIAILIVGAMVAFGGGPARAEGVSVTVTAADRALAAHLTTTYTHVSPAIGHVLNEAERAHPDQRDVSAGGRPSPAPLTGPTVSFDPNYLVYGSAPGNGGAYLSKARIHNVFVNCVKSGPTNNKIPRCWGSSGKDPASVPLPDQFIIDQNASGYTHVIDQYVGTTASNRYPLSTDVLVSYSLPNKQAAFTDIVAIVAKSATTLGSSYAGYGDMYVVYFPAGTDVCSQTQCFSQNAFCAFHSNAEGTIGGYPLHLVFAAIPYQDVPHCRVTGGPNELNDSMASMTAHEVAATITDPDGDAWFNQTDSLLAGQEIGDECQLTPFSRYPTITLNGHQYKMQLEYSNAVSACINQP